MNPPYEDFPGQYSPNQAPGAHALSYPEVCADFLAALSRSVKMIALYRLSHPMVIESLGRAASLLSGIVSHNGNAPVTVAQEPDTWLFNNQAVPAMPEASHLYNLLKAHAVGGLVFSAGVKSLDLGALCEMLSLSQKNQPEGFFRNFLTERGVKSIRILAPRRPERRYEAPEPYGSPARQAQANPATKKEASWESAVDEVFPVIFPGEELQPETPAEPVPAPQPQEAPRPRPAPAPLPKPAARPAPRTAPAAAAPAEPRAGEASKFYELKDKARVTAAPAPALHGAAAGPISGSGTGAGPGNGAGPGPGTGQGGGGAVGAGASSPAPARSAAAAQARQEKAADPGAAAKAKSLAEMNFGSLVTKLIESVVKDPNARLGAYKEALGLIQDAMRKQVDDATKELREENVQITNTRTRTENVLNAVAQGKVIVDKEGRVLMMNPAAEQIAGNKFSQVVGRLITDHVKPGEHFIALSGDMDLSSGKGLSGKVSLAGDKAVEDAIRRSMALLEDDEGRVVGAYTALPDVAKFKEYQRMQEEFLSRVTHDLQSPLSSITSALEMLTDSAGKKLDGTECKFLDISVRNSHRLVKMIREILDFSKLQSGKIELKLEPSPLGPMLAEAVEGLMPWAKSKGVNLVVRAPSPEITVMADHARIVQVVTNLVSNALKSTAQGGSILVASSRAPGHDNQVIIGVKDTGKGIAKEDLNKIFEKFVQIKSSEAREGVGLGLAIVKEFVTLHSGRIWAASEPGKGSTFYFTLPLA